MVLFGTKIEGDIEFAQVFPTEQEYFWHLRMQKGSPVWIEQTTMHRLAHLKTHDRHTFVGKDHDDISKPSHQYWYYEIEDTCIFYWENDGDTIYYESYCTPERLGFWFAHIFLPIYLTLRYEATFLHAASVDISGRRVVFLAPYRTGKSTLANYFLERGHTLVTDDILLVYDRSEGIYAVPSFPYCRPNRGAETLGDLSGNYSGKPKKMSAVFLLENIEEGDSVKVSELVGAKKFVILQDRYVLYSYFSHLRKKHFVLLGKLIAQSGIYSLKYPKKLEKLQEVYDMVISIIGEKR